MSASKVTGDLQVTGAVTANGGFRGMTRSSITEESLVAYPIPATDWRRWDELAGNIAAAAASDDLGLVTGTAGTNYPSLQSGDLKAAGATTRKAAAIVTLPPEYIAGQDVRVRFSAGMNTNAADASASIDLQAYKSDRDATSGSDLCSTSAIDINEVSIEDRDFVINAAGLAPGDELLLVVSLAINDAATGTAVIGLIGAAELLLDIKG